MYTDFERREDELHDARMEARRDEHHENVDTRCLECGTEWNCGLIRATRYQPAEPRYPDCPSCGSDSGVGI